ncbi:MAG: hypothetical protein V4671_07165 [Armatimonadota bacterium]
MRIKRRLLLTAVLLGMTGTVLSAAPTRPPARSASSPQQQVRSFLTFHLAHEGSLTAKNLEARKAWLAPALYNALKREIARGKAFQAKHPDEVPFIDGDVFVNSQEIPTAHRILPGKGADVTVEFRSGPAARVVRYRMALSGAKPTGQWRIEDVITDGESLMKVLQRSDYRTTPKPNGKS